MKDRRDLAPFPLDARRLVGDLSRAFNPMGRESLVDVEVVETREGMVCLSVVVPEGMTRAFVGLLDSLSGLVRFVDHKVGISKAHSAAVDPVAVLERREAVEEHRRKVCEIFDRFAALGLDRKEAVKRTAAALRAQHDPWSAFHLVEKLLRDSGRLRRAARPESRRSR